ncbi:Lrp/AsnC family transcriptional regulator [Nocardioides sp.]|jgi:Lrp/AsnC family transcriptional regulator, regulator for asnA, asnC and gidA|uniref:Lrp/AsnC family transcriptional regulator n=1 Tax=Nocardioides sp. TaxID=35761 RepID=UPI0026158421|nr:Lrp/AsnC family transcriptional regulator [Nocardioides sp.]
MADIEQNSTTPIVLDDLDRQILARLAEDGRMPYRQLARELGVSEGTIRGRTGRMEENGILRVVAIADPTRMGHNVLAFLLIKVAPGRSGSVVDALVAWPEATYVSDCVGEADIYVQVVCRDNQHLHDLLNDRIAAVDGITSVSTSIELKMHKISYQYS